MAGNPLLGFDTQIDALRETGAMLYQRGWSLGTSSNYSVIVNRDPLQLLITASGKDKGRLTRNDFVVVGEDGKPISEGQPKSSAETFLHIIAAQQLEDVGCILHTHSVWSTLLSDRHFAEGGLAIDGYEMLKGLERVKTHLHSEWVPIFENTQDIPSLAKEVAAKMQSEPDRIAHGYLIRKHGLYTWGKTVEEARRHIEIFEFLFECMGHKLMLEGTLPPSTPFAVE